MYAIYIYTLFYPLTLCIYPIPTPTLIADPRALVASGRENVELREIALLRQQQMQRDEQVKREQQLLYKQQQQLTSSTSSQFNTHTSHSGGEGQAGMGQKSDRVRTPYSSGFLFTVQPEYKVSAVSSEGKKAAAKVSVV